MPERLSREHHLRTRAERVRADLQALWGDDLPPGTPDPVTTLLVDAVAVDDQHGLETGFVVQGDGFGYASLARVLADVRSPATLQHVPPVLRARLVDALPAAGRSLELRTVGEDALPSASSGAWEYDPTTDTIAWDALGGTVCGLPGTPGTAPLTEWLRRGVHEDDRRVVGQALRSSAATGLPYEARFRVAPPRHGLVVARGRVLGVPGGGVRVLGFAAEDVDTPGRVDTP